MRHPKKSLPYSMHSKCGRSISDSSRSFHHPGCPHKSMLPLRVGTRVSPLALVQTQIVFDALSRFCPCLKDANAFEAYQVNTIGDQVQNRFLADIGGKGLFSREIHEALLQGRIDFAVHSLKDLETTLPQGLALACTLKRADVRDALILNSRYRGREIEPDLNDIPKGALIGSSSVRRQAQLMYYRPDLKFALLRGNTQTRIKKLENEGYDATLLAFSGLKRLGMQERADILFDPDFIVPAACQGIIGVTVRQNNEKLCELLSAVEDEEARVVSTAERALLAELGGCCRTPVGGYARLQKNEVTGDNLLKLVGLVARIDGSFLVKRELSGNTDDAQRIGRELGHRLRKESPADIFSETRICSDSKS